jgi:hypothetical protein
LGNESAAKVGMAAMAMMNDKKSLLEFMVWKDK